MTGPLDGIKVLEIGELGPVPHAAMQLADLGASVIRVERPSGGLGVGGPGSTALLRGRRILQLDLKDPRSRDDFLALAHRADVLIEGFRPGVMERLGLGPEACSSANPGLIYARMTGWGQEGPRASQAGHDLSYLAVSGVLHMIGWDGDPPPPPLNVIGDYGAGSMLVLVGILSALIERGRSGQGQVIDCAVVDGIALLSQQLWAMRSEGSWRDDRGTNLLDGGAPFYCTYRCADGRYLAVAAMEPKFYARLLEVLGLDESDRPDQDDRACWPELKALIARRIATRSRDDWAADFASVDACVVPVLTPEEALVDSHAIERQMFEERNGTVNVAPVPRFARTTAIRTAVPKNLCWESAQEVIAEWASLHVDLLPHAGTST